MTVAAGTWISLEVGCSYEACSELAYPLLNKLDSGKYDLCSVMEIPASIDDWRADNRTARKRAHRARTRGYVSGPLRRELHADDIYAINTSKLRRQGRPMTAGYLERHEFSPLPEYACDRHAIRATGVFDVSGDRRVCVAYLVMYRVGDLALVSQILGHADHLRCEVMWLLFETALRREIGLGDGVVVYNRHDSGEDGLRWWKERVGFREERVEWLP